MRGSSARGYLTSALALCFAAVLIGGEALILQAPLVDQADSQPRAEQAADRKQPCRPIPRLTLSWVPIRTRACVALHKNLRFFDAYRDDLNALSTLLVALFTFTLWRTTKGLFKAGERQITLIEKNAVEQARQTEESLRIAGINAEAGLVSANAANRHAIAAVGAELPILRVILPYLMSLPKPIPLVGPYATLDSFTISLNDTDVDAINTGTAILRIFSRIEYTDFMDEVWIIRAAWKWGSPEGLTDRCLLRDQQAPREYNRRTKIYP